MRQTDTTRSEANSQNQSWTSRIAWFVGLWLAGVATVAAISYGIRLWIM